MVHLCTQVGPYLNNLIDKLGIEQLDDDCFIHTNLINLIEIDAIPEVAQIIELVQTIEYLQQCWPGIYASATKW